MTFQLMWKLAIFSEHRPTGDGIDLVGARHFGRVLPRKQHRILADNRKACGVVGVGPCDTVIEPARGAIKALVLPESIARQRDLLVGEHRHDETGTSFVGVLSDPADQRQCRDGRGEEQVLSSLQPKPHLDGHFSKLVELHIVDRCARVLGHGIRLQELRLSIWVQIRDHYTEKLGRQRGNNKLSRSSTFSLPSF